MTLVTESDGPLEAELATDWEAEFAARTTDWNAADAMRSRPDWKSLTKGDQAKLYRERIRAAQKSRTLLNRISKRAQRELRAKEAAGIDISIPREYQIEWHTRMCERPPGADGDFVGAYVDSESPRPRRRKLWADRNF